MALLTSACAGGSDPADDPAVAAVEYETDLDALRALYPLGDFQVESVRWRYHNDFVTVTGSSGDIPAQDANKIVEAVFVFTDDAVRDSLLAGRTTTLSDIPTWYPNAITADSSATVAVSRSVDGLPGIVSVFPEIPGYLVVSYDPNAS